MPPDLPGGLDVPTLVNAGIRYAFGRWSREALKVWRTDYDRKTPQPDVIEATLVEPSLPPTLPASRPVPETGEECPACVVDDAVIKARGRVEAFLLDAETNGGTISPEMPATLYLARGYLATAESGTAAIRAKVPSIASSCDRLLGCIGNCQAALPDPQRVTVDDCMKALPTYIEAQRESTAFVVAYQRAVKRAIENDRYSAIARSHGVQDPGAMFRELNEEIHRG